MTGRLPWAAAKIDDRHFYKFLENPEFLLTIFPITPGLNHILHRILTIIPDEQCSLSEMRRLVRNLDRFWLTEQEVSQSRYLAVKETWRDNAPVDYMCGGAPSEESGDFDSSDDWESACGDTLRSDTSSESGGSRGSGAQEQAPDLPTKALLEAEEGIPPSVSIPPKPFSLPLPEELEVFNDEPLPAVPAIMRTASSDEFPIREPGSNLAGIPDSTTSSSSSESDGPDTPPTHAHDPAAIVSTQQLSDNAPLKVADRAEDGKMTGARRMSLVLWALIYGQEAS